MKNISQGLESKNLIDPPAASVTEPKQDYLPSTTKKQATILVVDDDPTTVLLLVSQLKKSNYRILTAQDGIQALEVFESEIPDLVILDLMMPRMSGYEVCKRIREKYDAATIPILMLTAKNQKSDLVTGFRLGANDYLVKPFQEEELKVRVNLHLQLKASIETLKENQRLRKEIERRTIAERELRLAQRRLARILDKSDEAILSINEIGQIIYLNRPAEEILGYSDTILLGKPYTVLVPDKKNREEKYLSEIFSNLTNSTENLQEFKQIKLKRADGQIIGSQASISAFEMEEENVFILTLRDPNSSSKFTSEDVPPTRTSKLIAELNRNRKRIQSLEDALNELTPSILEKQPQVLHELKTLDIALNNLVKSFLKDNNQMSVRETMVEVMKLALKYWEQAMQSTKDELAAASSIWKVYFEQDGRHRTQTMDKYFDLVTLPQKPRYKKVGQTADFVLATCKLDTPLRRNLELSLAKLQALT